MSATAGDRGLVEGSEDLEDNVELIKGLRLNTHAKQPNENDESGKARESEVKKQQNTTKKTKQPDLAAKTKSIKQDAPQLVITLDDFRGKLGNVEEFVKVQLGRIQDEEFPTAEGVSFLEARYHLLLQYCIDLVYYLLLKTDGGHVVGSPVIDDLIRVRTYVEKIRPLDKKLKYQIDKLLRTAAPEGGASATGKKDPLSAKANPSNFALPGDEDEGENGDDDHEDSESDDDGAYSHKRASNQKYKPPKISAVPYNEDTGPAKAQRDDKRKQKALKSSLVRDLIAMHTDEPEEIKYGVERSKEDEYEEEKQAYEEDYMIRLAETKKDKQIRKKRMRQQNTFGDELDSLGKFSDLAAFDIEQQDEGAKELEDYRQSKRQRVAEEPSVGFLSLREDADPGGGRRGGGRGGRGGRGRGGDRGRGGGRGGDRGRGGRGGDRGRGGRGGRGRGGSRGGNRGGRGGGPKRGPPKQRWEGQKKGKSAS